MANELEQSPALTAENIAERFGRIQTSVACARCGEPDLFLARPTPDGGTPPSPAGWLCAGCAEYDHHPVRWPYKSIDSIERSERRLAALNIPPTHSGSSLDTFGLYGTPEDRTIQARALDFARWYVDNWVLGGLPRVPRCVAIYGPRGNGKRTLAYAIGRELALHHPVYARVARARIVTHDLCSRHRATVLINSGLLIVTQLDRETFASPHAARLLADIVARRSAANRPTLLTIDERSTALDEVLERALPPCLAGVVKRVYSGSASARSSRPGAE